MLDEHTDVHWRLCTRHVPGVVGTQENTACPGTTIRWRPDRRRQCALRRRTGKSRRGYLDSFRAAGSGEPGPAVVIVANWVGCHAADLLTAQGYSLTVVDVRDALGYDMDVQQGMVLRDRVADSCTIALHTSAERIFGSAVSV